MGAKGEHDRTETGLYQAVGELARGALSRQAELVQDEAGFVFIGQQRIGLQERVAVNLDHGREVNHHSALGRLYRGLESGSRDFTLEEDYVGIGDGEGAGGDKGGVDNRIGTGGDDDGVLAIGRDGNDGEAGIGVGLLHGA